MLITERQKDALTELVNIAFGRTAASLSDLTGQRVILGTPQVDICPIDGVRDALCGLTCDELATVHQIFTGPMAGDALLVLDYESAARLVQLLLHGRVVAQPLTASGREVLAEVGNILLNACLGMFGNLLQVTVSFSVPRVHQEDLESLLSSLVIGGEELCYALVVRMDFHLSESAVAGYLIIVLGVTSLERLMQAIEGWADSQGG